MQGLPATVEDQAAAVERLARLLGERMQGACAELDRIDGLLGQAIGQLLGVFTDLHAQLQARQEQFASGMAGDARQAVMALQFRDVVGQKLGHVRRELATLERGLTDFCATPGSADPQALVPRIEQLLGGLQQSQAPSPAPQEVMRAGAVDLF